MASTADDMEMGSVDGPSQSHAAINSSTLGAGVTYDATSRDRYDTTEEQNTLNDAEDGGVHKQAKRVRGDVPTHHDIPRAQSTVMLTGSGLLTGTGIGSC